MKKIVLISAVLMIAGSLRAEFNVELETRLIYMNYFKNEAFATARSNAAAQGVSLNAVEAYQQIRTKYEDPGENVKFKFDARFYLRPQAKYFDYSIDSAYFQLENSGFVVYAGKQRLKWGTGYIWNPSDLLQAGKNPLDPSKNLEGILAVRAEFSNDIITPSLIVMPDPKVFSDDFAGNFTYALQLYRNIGAADIFINGIYKYNILQSIGAALSWDIEWFVMNLEGAAIRYMDTAYAPLGLLGKAGPKDIKYSYTAGIQKTIGDFFINLEFYSNGWGAGNDDGSFAGETVFGTHQAYAAGIVSYTWEQALALSLTALWGMNGGAGFMYPSLSWVQSQEWNLTISWLQNVSGSFNKEWLGGIPLHNSIDLRLNGYF